MRDAAAKPVSSEIWAFHCSTGSIERKWSSRESPSVSTSCSGSGSDTPPRAASRSSRSVPTSLSSMQRLGGAAVVDASLRLLVVELLPGADACSLDRDVGALPGGVDLDRPEQGGTLLAGQQRAGRLGDRLRVERDLGVGTVERLATTVRLLVDRVPRRHERGHVGDGVVDDVAVAGPLEVECLVEVHGRRRVDRDELQVGAVQLRQPRLGRRPRRGRLDLGRELRRHPQLLLDRRDTVAQLGRHTALAQRLDPDHSTARHPLTLTFGRCSSCCPRARERRPPLAASRSSSPPWPIPSLTGVRRRVVEALVTTSQRPDAGAILGIGHTQLDLIQLNRVLESAPTARADRVYTGVLYEALGFDSLSPAARRRSAHRVAITSSVFGLVRPTDRIPAYRLSGDASLPDLGSVAAAWREVLGDAVRESVGDGLLVDLRSGTYAAFWRPPADLRPAGRDGAGAPRERRPTHRGQPLQQGHEGAAGPTRCSRTAATPARPPPSPTPCATSAGTSRRRPLARGAPSWTSSSHPSQVSPAERGDQRHRSHHRVGSPKGGCPGGDAL